MEMTGIQGVGIGAIIPHSNPLGELMLVQGKKKPKCVSYRETKEKA
jgi:hypothetical protein